MEAETVDPLARRRFLDARQRSHRDRYNRPHAATYDRDWGDISPTHLDFLSKLLVAAPSPGRMLDAPCGTGK